MASDVLVCRLVVICVVCITAVVCQPTVQEFRWSETCNQARDEDFRDALDFILIELKRQNHENRQLRLEVDELRQKTTEQRHLLLQLSESVTLLVRKLVTENQTCVCDTQSDGHLSILEPWPEDTIVISEEKDTKPPPETTSTTTPTTTTTTTTPVPTSPTPDPLLALYGGYVPTDCEDVRNLGFSTNGTYHIRPNGSSIHFTVVCEFHVDSVWTLIQRRIDGSLDFFRKWDEYKHGFGNISSEFWLGNEKIHLLTRQRAYGLGIDMWDWPDPSKEEDVSTHYFSQSSYFRVDNETSHYRLHVPQDYFSYTGFGGSGLRVHAGPFLTYDHVTPRMRGNCAVKFHCGWWFSTCVRNANFNGRYYKGGYENVNSRTRSRDDIYWPNIEQSLQSTTLKLQRANETVVDLFS
ncbi:fibrinogen-like protein 1 [Haliotis asinina]|uniref:fibrinogen-like protein 1 n=1 Tax=Haliotis asinina TaxID=109174 RepID=UPI0035323525